MARTLTQREMLIGPYPLAITVLAQSWSMGESVPIPPLVHADKLAHLKADDFTAGLRRQPERHWRRRRGN